MSGTPDLSEARRALLEKYLRGEVTPPPSLLALQALIFF